MATTYFQRLLVVLLGSLITLAFAQPLAAKADYILDGSFEHVSNKIASNFQMNLKAGGWVVRHRAVFDINTPGEGTPYGTKFVVFFPQSKPDTRGYVTQDLENLPLEPLTLRYEHLVRQNENANCTFTVTFDEQVLDQWSVPVVQEQDWTGRTVSFTPEESSGKLKFDLYCPRTTPFAYWEVDLDAISLFKATSD